MLAPTPAIQPSPLDISGLFSASVGALRRRFWLFILIALVPSIVTAVVVAIGVGSMFAAVAASLRSDGGAAASAGLLAGVAVMLIGVVVGALAQLKSYGMLSLAAYEVAQNQEPTFGGLWQRSRGFLPRMAAVIAIVFVVMAVVSGVIVALAVAAAGATANTYRDPGATVLVIFGMFALFAIALIPIGLFFVTKLMYTIPAIAIEGRGGMDGLKRSWTLTRGSFWRTLGYYLVAYLAVLVVSYLVSFLSQALVGSSAAGLNSIPSGAGPAYLLGRLSVLLPAVAISTALQLIVSALTTPFLQAYTTYMFIDQVRRSELPSAATSGYPGAPGYYAQPGQYYGQPAQGYPAPGYGNPATPPAAGQPYPGAPQPYPGAPQTYPGQPYGNQPQPYASQPQPGHTPQQPSNWPGQPTPPQQPSASPYPQGWGTPPASGPQPPAEPWSRPQNPDDSPGDRQG